MSLTIENAQALALARLTAIVQGANPRRHTELRFTAVETDEGRETDLELMASGFRYFQWRYAGLDDRPTDRVSCRVVQSLVLRVRYDRDAIDRVNLERVMAEDVLVINDALRIPSAWQMGTSGIKVVTRSGIIGTTTLPSVENPRITIVGIPYALTLEACC